MVEDMGLKITKYHEDLSSASKVISWRQTDW
jgi:hypothetical protein